MSKLLLWGVLTSLLALMLGCSTSQRAHPLASRSARQEVRSSANELITERRSPRRIVVDRALEHVGTRYKFGGNGDGQIDCSALVKNIYQELNILLPRNSAAQFRHLSPHQYKTNRLVMPGDLVFFRTRGRQISHVGIMMDEINFIHASPGYGVVTKGTLKDRYWRKRIVGFADPFGEIHHRDYRQIAGTRAAVWE